MIAVLILTLATTLSGVVHDPSGAVVSSATVVVKADGAEHRTTTGPDGRFAVDVSGSGEMTIVVRAGGFAEATERVTDASRAIDITLAPAPLMETVTVTAGRSSN